MKQHISSKKRRELQAKMSKVFKQNVRALSTEMREILMDDMVTAFENRMRVLTRTQRPPIQISDAFDLVEKQVEHA